MVQFNAVFIFLWQETKKDKSTNKVKKSFEKEHKKASKVPENKPKTKKSKKT